MAKRRSKPTDVPVVRNLEQANEVLAELAAHKRELDQINGALNERIDQAKAAAEEKAAPVRDRVTALEVGLTSFAEHHKGDLFGKKRSVDLSFGRFGFRRSTQVKPVTRTTWAVVLERLKNLGMRDAIRVKEQPNKEVLREWPDERLAQVCVRRVEHDDFWYELDEAELGETSA